MRHFRVVLLPLVALLPIAVLRAQDTGTISGVVTAKETGAGVPAARIAIPAARLSATTDLDGRYTITGVPPGTYRLEARRIGYSVAQAVEVVVTAGQTTTADFGLERLAISLSEVVVVGYGTQVRRDVTGSVTSVAGPDVQRTVTGNAIDAIKGRVAGVDIVSERHMPGSGVRVRIRGERSLENAHPISTLRNRAAGAPCATRMVCIGSPLPQFGSPQICHDARSAIASHERQKSGVLPV